MNFEGYNNQSRGEALFSVLEKGFNRLRLFIALKWVYLSLPLTVLGVVHIMLCALYPGGQNRLLATSKQDTPGYLSWFGVTDVFGLDPITHGELHYLYRIYTQDGGQVSGSFPNTTVKPRLRHDRWQMAGSAMADSLETDHGQMLEFILEQFPAPPVKIELFTVRWQWDRNVFRFPWPGEWPRMIQDLKLLGTYDGITRSWRPVTAELEEPSPKPRKKRR
ncbi:MAG: hypothetical protein OEZ59_06690 [Deltaproteobacteria bacterium]|nr:hypothetical protein [Deltaproteobacteria bacterium]